MCNLSVATRAQLFIHCCMALFLRNKLFDMLDQSWVCMHFTLKQFFDSLVSNFCYPLLYLGWVESSNFKNLWLPLDMLRFGWQLWRLSCSLIVVLREFSFRGFVASAAFFYILSSYVIIFYFCFEKITLVLTVGTFLSIFYKKSGHNLCDC